MTKEVFSRTPTYTIASRGPYTITHPYRDVSDLRISVVQDEIVTDLTGADYEITPEASDLGGSLTLSASVAELFAGGKLYVSRNTLDEQGWVGSTAREVGLEAQLDIIVMSLQDHEAMLAGKAQLPLGADNLVLPVPDPGKLLIARDDALGWENGPDADQIEKAQGYAELAQELFLNAGYFSGNTNPGFTDVLADLQYAADYLSERGGGFIKLRPEVHRLSGTLNVPENVFIVGEGAYFTNDYVDNGVILRGTWLSLDAEANVDVVRFAPPAAELAAGNYPRMHSGLRDLGVHGNRSGLESPLDDEGNIQNDRNQIGNCVNIEGASYVTLQNVILFRAAEHGVESGTADFGGTIRFRTSNNITMIDVTSIGNGKDGFRLFDGDSKFIGLVAGYNGRDGINTGSSPITGVRCWNNMRYGAILQGDSGVLSSGEIYDNKASGVRLERGTGHLLTNLRVYDNGRDGDLEGADRAGVSIAELAGEIGIANCHFAVKHRKFRIAFLEIASILSGYPDGFWPDVPLDGGTGDGAKVDITVVDGHVTLEQQVDHRGGDYTTGDALTLPVGSAVRAALPGLSLFVFQASYPFTGNQLYGISAPTGAPRVTASGLTFDGVIGWDVADTGQVTSNPTVLSSRTELLSRLTEIPTLGIAQVGGLQWIKDGSDGIPDMPGFAPAGEAYVDHYGENTVPGTTDMSDAIEAAMSANILSRLRDTTYRVTRTLNVYARRGSGLSGVAANYLNISEPAGSEILLDEGDFDLFNFYTRERVGIRAKACYNVTLRNFSIQSLGQRTGGWYFTSEERMQNLRIEDVVTDNPYNGFRILAAGYSWITRLSIKGSNRETTGGTALLFTSSATAGAWTPAAHVDAAKCTDVHVTDLQINAESTLNPALHSPFEFSLEINSADGIYFDKGHIRGGRDGLVIGPNKSPGQTVVSSVTFFQTYFDSTEMSHVVFRGFGSGEMWRPDDEVIDGVLIEGVEQRLKFRSIKFNGCTFREAKGVQGSIDFSGIADGQVDRVTITDGQIRDNRHSGIRDAATGFNVTGLTVSDVEFSGNNIAGLTTNGDIYLRSAGHIIKNNEFKPSDTDTDVGYHIRLLEQAGALPSEVRGNNFVHSPITAPSRRISRQTADYCSDNAGFRQDARGEVTISNPNTNVIVTHGLAETPIDVQITPRTDGVGVTRYWYDLVGPATFRVNTNATPTSSMAFAWRATSGVRS